MSKNKSFIITDAEIAVFAKDQKLELLNHLLKMGEKNPHASFAALLEEANNYVVNGPDSIDWDYASGAQKNKVATSLISLPHISHNNEFGEEEIAPTPPPIIVEEIIEPEVFVSEPVAEPEAFTPEPIQPVEKKLNLNPSVPETAPVSRPKLPSLPPLPGRANKLPDAPTTPNTAPRVKSDEELFAVRETIVSRKRATNGLFSEIKKIDI